MLRNLIKNNNRMHDFKIKNEQQKMFKLCILQRNKREKIDELRFVDLVSQHNETVNTNSSLRNAVMTVTVSKQLHY